VPACNSTGSPLVKGLPPELARALPPRDDPAFHEAAWLTAIRLGPDPATPNECALGVFSSPPQKPLAQFPECLVEGKDPEQGPISALVRRSEGWVCAICARPRSASAASARQGLCQRRHSGRITPLAASHAAQPAQAVTLAAPLSEADCQAQSVADACQLK